MANVAPTSASAPFTSPVVNSNPTFIKAMKEGRTWKGVGAGMIVGGIVLATVSILIISILCSKFGNSVASIGERSAKMVDFMRLHSDQFIIAGLGGSALGGLFFITGIVSIFHGRYMQRRAHIEQGHRYSPLD